MNNKPTCLNVTNCIKAAAKYLGIEPQSFKMWLQTYMVDEDEEFNFDEAFNTNRITAIKTVTNHHKKKFQRKHLPSSRVLLNSLNNLFQNFKKQLELNDSVDTIYALVDSAYDVYVNESKKSDKFEPLVSREEYYTQNEYKIYEQVKQALIDGRNGLYSDEKGLEFILPILDEKGNSVSLANESGELDQDVIEGLDKIIDNFDDLWMFAKLRMKQDQGILMDCASDTVDIINYDEDVLLSELDEMIDGSPVFDYENSPKESWQEVKEFIKAYKQLSAETRRILYGIPQYDVNGNVKKNKFGIPRTENVARLHKRLIQEMYDVTSESEMIERLEEMSSNGDSQADIILARIDGVRHGETEDNSKIDPKSTLSTIIHNRTMMFLDMQRTPMMYCVAKITRSYGKIKKYITSINTTDAQSGDVLYRKYVGVVAKKLLDLTKSHLFKDGKPVDAASAVLENRSRRLNLIESFNPEAEQKSENNPRNRVSSFLTQMSASNQLSIITDILDDFGIPYEQQQIRKLLRRKSNNDLAILLVNLKDLIDRTKKIKNLGSRDLESIVSKPLSTMTNDTLQIPLSQILRILNKDNYYAQQTFRSSGSFMNPRKGQVDYQTAQLRGFMSDMFADIRKAIEKTLKKDDGTNYLKEYLDKRFLNNPLFVDYNDDGTIVKDKHNNPVIKNYWVELLYNSDLKDSNSFANVFMHYQFVGSEKGRTDTNSYSYNSDAQTFEDFSELDFITTMFTAFVQPKDQQVLGRNIGKNFAEYPSFILGDSGKQKFIRAARLSMEDGEIIPRMAKVVQQEWKFYQETQLFNDSLENSGYNKFELIEKDDFNPFKTFPELNDIIDKETSNIKDEEQRLDEIMNLMTNNDWLEEQVEKIMNERFKKFLQKCEDSGVMETVKMENGKNEYLTYPHLPLREDGYDLDMKDGANNKDIAEKFLKDYYYNSTFAMTQQIQMTTLSPMLYKDSVEMQKRFKQVHANGRRPSLEAKDYNGSKYSDDGNMRYIVMKDVVANPKFTNNMAFMQTVAYVAGVEELRNSGLSEKQIQQMSEEDIIKKGKKTRKYKKYEETSYTDGQGIRSLEGYRKIKGMLGEWSRDDELTYNRIMDIRKKAYKRAADAKKKAEKERKSIEEQRRLEQIAAEWTDEEKREVSNLTQVWQPIKPFVYGLESYALSQNDGGDNTFYMPQQIKCSECLVIPELLPTNSRMRIIASYIDTKHIDCAYFDSCIKVGAFGQVETYYKNEPANRDNMPRLLTAEELRKSLEGEIDGNKPYVHTMSYQYYVEQNAVTEHTYNSRTIGTQMRKLFFDGLRDGKSYENYVNGEVTLPDGSKTKLNNREQLAKFFSSLHCANVLAKFEDVMRVIENDTTLSKELQKIAMRSDNQTMSKLLMYAAQTVYDEQGNSTNKTKFPIPLFENAMEHDAAASVISIFKKATVQLKMDGGSLVQATSYGISEIKTVEDQTLDVGDLQAHIDDNNIIYSDAEMPFKFEYTDKNGNKKQLDYDKYCNSDGTLKKVKGTDLSLMERDFPGSTTMVCYRIPSERHYSALVIKVKRFTKPVEGGGVLKLPVQVTTITGSDFDIDKMFLMRKQFIQRHDAETFDEYLDKTFKKDDPRIKQIWNYIYSHSGKQDLLGLNGLNIMAALQAARKKSSENKAGSAEQEAELQKPLNSFWDLARDLYPQAFTTEDGERPSKAEIFAHAAKRTHNIDITYKNKDEFKFYEYDQNKAVHQQYRNKKLAAKGVKSDIAVRNNMMLQLMIARLQDKETVESRTTPGGFENCKVGSSDLRYMMNMSKEDGNKIIDATNTTGLNLKNLDDYKEHHEDPNTTLNYSDPMTLVEFNKQNQISMKLVGTFANYNSFKALLSSVKQVRLTKPIKLFGRNVSSLTDTEIGRPSGLYVAELLAAAVDAVKDPTLKFLNITQSTAATAALMAMGGYNPREIGIFLNQPIVRKVTKYCEQNHCGLSTAINAIKNKYYKDKKSTKDFYNSLTATNLISQVIGSELQDKIELNKNNLGSEVMKLQFNVLQALEEIANTSVSLGAHLNATKLTSANSIESTFGSIYSIMQAAERLNSIPENKKLIKIQTQSTGMGNIDNSVSPINTKLNSQDPNYMQKCLEQPFPIEQVIYDVCKTFVNKTQKFFPYNNATYKESRDFFKGKTSNNTLSPKTINQIHHDVQVFALRQVPNSLFSDASIAIIKDDPVDGSILVSYTPQNFFKNEFPGQFKVVLEENADKYPTLYRCLDFTEGGRIDITFGYDVDADRDAFTNEWRELINNNPSEGLNLGYCLYLYNFHANAFQFNRRSFDYLFPQDKLSEFIVGYANTGTDKNERMEPVLYRDVLQLIEEGKIKANSNFFIQYLQNHHNSGELVKTIYDKEQTAKLTKNKNESGNIVINPAIEDFDFFLLSQEEIQVGNKTKNKYKFPVAIKVDKQFYIAVKQDGFGGYNIQNEVVEGDNIMYVPFRTYDTLTYNNSYTQLGEPDEQRDNEDVTQDLLDGSILEPVTWKALEELRSGDQKYDYRIAIAILNETKRVLDTNLYNNDLMNDFVSKLRQIYIEYMQDLAENADAGIRLVQKHKNLIAAYNRGNLTADQKDTIAELNRNLVTRMMIQQLCPDFRILSGQDKFQVVQTIGLKVINNNLTEFNDIKDCVVSSLLELKGSIQESVEASKLAAYGEVLKSEDLLAEDGENIKPTCKS